MELTKGVLLEGNYVHGNGSLTTYYNHNVYNEASNVTYQFNRFGPPAQRAGVDVQGANIKERSAGRHPLQLDRGRLARDRPGRRAGGPGHDALDESFHQSYGYGNVIVRGTKASGSMVHYGGDSDVFKNYRKGALYFYSNTVIVRNRGHADYQGTAVFELSTKEARLDARDNIFFSVVPPRAARPVVLLGARDEKVSGVASLAGNWVADGWTQWDTRGGRNAINAEITGLDASKRGADPGFLAAASDSYGLSTDATVRRTGVPITDAYVRPELFVKQQYVPHQSGRARPASDPPTPGALED